MQGKTHHTAVIATLILALAATPLAADMMPGIPDSFFAIGPDIGWFWSDNLSGLAIGFDALKSFSLLTASFGMRHVFSRDDGYDFAGNKGLLSVYIEGTATLPLPLGIGFSYNWALGHSSGPGMHLYWSIPMPFSKEGYVSVFYRPTWIWLDGNAETCHQLGIAWRFSNVVDKMGDAKRPRGPYRPEEPQTNTAAPVQ
jgi:hypothetical protein